LQLNDIISGVFGELFIFVIAFLSRTIEGFKVRERNITIVLYGF